MMITLPWLAVAFLLRHYHHSGETHESSRHGKNANNLLPLQASRLSHAMFQIENVQDAVEYWIRNHGGRVVRSLKNDDGSYKGAFVTLASEDDFVSDDSFALELTTANTARDIGNCLSYLGVNMLDPDNLLGVITAEKEKSKKPDEVPPQEPNGLTVRKVASAPGDPLARLCLKSFAPLEDVQDFYEALGMSVRAVDERMVCLRYEQPQSGQGVPTTLVFETLDEPLRLGNVLDHLVIETTDSVDAEYQKWQDLEAPIFMKPVEMFGTKLMGLRDPNGYKVILAEKAA